MAKYMRLDAEVRKFAESIQQDINENGLHADDDQSALYARAKDGLKIIADCILTDGDGLVKACANMGKIIMALAHNSGGISDE